MPSEADVSSDTCTGFDLNLVGVASNGLRRNAPFFPLGGLLAVRFCAGSGCFGRIASAISWLVSADPTTGLRKTLVRLVLFGC